MRIGAHRQTLPLQDPPEIDDVRVTIRAWFGSFRCCCRKTTLAGEAKDIAISFASPAKVVLRQQHLKEPNHARIVTRTSSISGGSWSGRVCLCAPIRIQYICSCLNRPGNRNGISDFSSCTKGPHQVQRVWNQPRSHCGYDQCYQAWWRC